LGIGDWGFGIWDWAQSPIPNPQYPIIALNNYIILNLELIFNLQYIINIIKKLIILKLIF